MEENEQKGTLSLLLEIDMYIYTYVYIYTYIHICAFSFMYWPQQMHNRKHLFNKKWSISESGY